MCQPIPLKGKVVNKNREPIAGATVVLKRTNTSAVSAEDGSFSFPAAYMNDTLVVSASGYQTVEEPNNERGLVTVVLRRKESTLEEVTVNTGYQKLPRERATGSFTTLSNNALNQQVTTGIIDRLNGMAGSMLFQSKLDGPGYMVRGLSTINGPKAPLVVVDNFPYEGDLNNINPSDVESITILKDAAASSIWGTRAGNGVIVITTKRGHFSQPLQVGLNTAITISNKPDLFSLPQISSSDYIDVEQFLFTKNFYNAQLTSNQRPALSPLVEILASQRSGALTQAQAEAAINTLRSYDVRKDYDKYFYRGARRQQYALSLSGGTANLAWLLSAGFDKNISELHSPYDRLTIRAHNQYKPSKNLQLTLGFTYTGVSSASGRPAWNSILVGTRRVPYLRFADEMGNPLPVARQLRSVYTDTAGGGKLLNWNYYPLEDYKHNTTENNLTDLVANMAIQYKIHKALSLDVSYQYQQQTTASKTLQDVESFAARDMINRYTMLNRSTGAVRYNVPLGAMFSWTDARLKAHNVRSQFGYNNTWGNWHLSSIGGAEWREITASSIADGVYGYDPQTLAFANVDYVNTYPTFITGSMAAIPSRTSFGGTLNRFISFFANAAATWKDKYTVSASGRRDASNLFGLRTNDKWNPLWSAGGAWVLSKESFYKSTFLPRLKLRATYGYSGNVDQSRAAVTVINYAGTDNFTNLPRALVSQFANPELRWEKLGQLNIGLDFTFRTNRVTGSIDYYIKRGHDLFGPSLIDYTTGLGTNLVTKNVASMKAKGLDLVINTKNTIGAIKWTTTLLANYNLAVTDDYYRAPGLASTWISSGNTIAPQPGKPLYSVISYKWAGLDNTGAPQGVLNGSASTNYNNITGNGTAPSDLVFAGSALPKYFGSVFNSVSFRGFTLSANITYKLAYWFRRETISYNSLFTAGVGHADYEKRWQKPGDDAVTNVPSLVYPLPANRDAFFTNSEVTVERGDHIRLQFINLAYDAKDLCKGSPFKQLQLYFNGANLGIIWKRNSQDIDPDFTNSLQTPKAFSFGIRSTL